MSGPMEELVITRQLFDLFQAHLCAPSPVACRLWWGSYGRQAQINPLRA